MSSKIDERVVQMKFDSNQFQKGVADTSSALDKLKSALDLKSGNFDLTPLMSSVDNLSGKFTGLQAVALGALATIGAKAVDLGIQMARDLGNNLVSSAREGFAEYETQMGAIQTIMANTSSKGTTMAQVNDALAELNRYADMTIYNFSEMTRNIGTFTAAGVDLDTATAAIKGIANLAAVSGSNSQQASTAMYQLSQAMASGTVKLMDWNSVVNAGMGGQVFQDALKETARAHGQNVDELIAKNGSFRDSLQEGWLTTAVLTDTLAKFTGDLSREQILAQGYTEAQADEIMRLGEMSNDAATKVKTFSQLMETLAEAQGSGWAQSFQIILGDFEEAKALFTEISDLIGGMIGESADARNEQLQIWKDMGGRTAIIDALRNAFTAVMKIITPIKEAFKDVFPPSMGKNLAAISFALRDFTAGLIISDGAAANIKMVATGLFKVLKFGIDIVTGIARVVGFLVGFVLNLAGAFLSLLGPVLTFVRSLMPVKEGAEEASTGVKDFFDMLLNGAKFLTGWLPDAIRNLGKLFNDFLNDGGATKRIQEFVTWSQKLAATIAMVYNVLAKGDFTGGGFFTEDSKFVDVLFNIRDGIVTVVDAFHAFSSAAGDAAGRANDFWSGTLGVIKKVWEYIKPVADAIGKFFGDIMAGIDLDTVLAGINVGVLVAMAVGIGKVIKAITGAFGGVGDIMGSLGSSLEGLVGVLEAYQTKLKADALMKIAISIGILAGALWVLSTIDPNRMISAVAGMSTSFGILLAGLAILDKIEAEPSLKASVALSLIAVAVNILASAVQKLGSLNPEQLTSGLIGVAAAMAILVTAAQMLDGMDGSILKSSAALILMASALVIVAGAVALFGIMPMEMLIQGFIGVTAAMALLVGAAVILAKFAPQMALSAVGLMAMAAALNMMILPITTLGLLPLPILLQGMLALGVVLFGLVLAAQSMAAIAPQMAIAALGMMAMAFAINMLVAPIFLLGSMDLLTLIVGLAALAAVMLILVVATNAMTTAAPGAVAMIAVAAAILILSFALSILAGIGLEGMILALVGLVAALLIMGIASVAMAPIAPAMYAVAGAMAIFALGMLALAAALLIGVLAISLLGPAIMLAVGGLLVFAGAADVLLAAAGPMAVLGAALIAFGAGALVAGAGSLVLGLGLIALGAGLALVGAVGIIGALALKKVVEGLMELLVHIPGMLALGGTFLALGAGVLVLGAGLLVLGAGALLVGVALLLLVPLGAAVVISVNMIIKALERLAPMAGEMDSIGKSLKKLGEAVEKLADNGRTASNGLKAITSSFTGVATGATMAGMSVQMMAMGIGPSIGIMVTSIQRAPMAFQLMATAILLSMTTMNAGLTAGAAQAEMTAGRMGRSVGTSLVFAISANNFSVYIASVNLGEQMIAGMNKGLQNGSDSVGRMASRVAKTALDSAKDTLGVASPSKEFEKVGKWSDDGLVRGMMKNMGAVSAAGDQVGKTALNSMRASLSNLKNAVMTDMDMTPTIRPVLDLSGLKKDAGQINGLLKPPTLTVNDSYATAASIATSRRETEREDDSPSSNFPDDGPEPQIVFKQELHSPKALSRVEIYRQTNNLITAAKGALSKP